MEISIKEPTLKSTGGVFHLYFYMGLCGCEDKKYNPTLCEDKRECFKTGKVITNFETKPGFEKKD